MPPYVPGTTPRVKLLTDASKMPCYSWGLPAHRSCPNAVDGPNAICATCYAEKGRYAMPGTRHAQEERFKWTLESMITPWGRDLWVETMVTAVKWAVRPVKVTHNQMREDYLAWLTRRRQAGLSTSPEWSKTFKREWRAAYKARAGRKYRPTVTYREQPQYFRVHDSGDLFSPKYADCWRRVCEALPGVSFWFPTRVWPHGHKPLNLLTHAAILTLAALPNVMVRPSALFFDDAAPEVEGYGPGSSASASGYNCPAHEQDNECRECRACWHADHAIVYRKH